MLVLLSPAKSLDFDPLKDTPRTQARMKKDTMELVEVMREKKASDLKQLMSISDKLADLNVARFQAFQKSHSGHHAKQAMYAFTGDVYVGLDATSLSEKEVQFAQDHLRILSGLYGLLRPLDVIQPYRLEMGTHLKTTRGSKLYEFWGDSITNLINKDLKASKSKSVLNLASKEYYSAVDPKQINAKILDVDFREYRDGKLKFISFSAKKARGLMARYVIRNRIKTFEKLKGFDYAGYAYDEAASTPDKWCFTR